MAEKALQKVEDKLNCSICLDIYTDPKQLQCNHVFCRKCLVRLVDRDQQRQLILTCPICRQRTPVPANGVAGLRPAFHINHFLEIAKEFKMAITSAERVETDSTTPIPQEKIKVFCREHRGKEVELYCDTCEEPICLKCAIKGGKHHSHDYGDVEKAYEKYKTEITASLEPMEKQLTALKKALAQVDTSCGEVSDQRAVIEAKVHKTFRKLHEVLDIRKTELIDQLHQMTQWKLKSLAVQKDQIETTLAQLSSCLDFMRESLQTIRQVEVLTMKQRIERQVKELTTMFPKDTLNPNTRADIAFSASADITRACHNFGQLSISDPPDPSQCYVTSKGIDIALAGETSTAVLQVINLHGQPCKEPLESSECELVSEITGSRSRGIVERSGESQYEISYHPNIKGRHQLHITAKGQHIRGSPFSVAAKSPVHKLGTPILTLGGVSKPWGIAVNQSGEIVITEWRAACVSVFSPSGEKLRSFSTHNSDKSQMNYPHGVAVDAEGNILVVAMDSHCIRKYTATGQFLAAVGTKGKGPLQFHQPKGIAFNAHNNKLYVTDSFTDCVQVLNSDLTFFTMFGEHGTGKGEFNRPTGIACDNENCGEVYVADHSNHRIQVFTAEGEFLRVFGRHGWGKGELHCPRGLATDASGMVYVSNGGNISIFTLEGKFVTLFGSEGKRPGQFQCPYGLCVDNSGVVYVCDLDNSRVQIF